MNEGNCISTEANKIADAFSLIWKKAREAENLEQDGTDNSLAMHELQSMVLLMNHSVVESCDNIIGAR